MNDPKKGCQLNRVRLFALLLAAALVFSFFLVRAQDMQSDIARGVLRLHVIANSDTAADQALKLKVRDRVLAEADLWLCGTDSREEAMRAVSCRMREIERAARDEIARNGYSYAVRAEIGKFPFPTKTYGSVVLPAGRYDAVRIVIGEGRGQNWWCVMFPPLCFVNGAASLPDESREQLRAALGDEEYALITEQDSGEMPVQIKFKLAELAGELMEFFK